MTHFDTTAREFDSTDLNDRNVRALTEVLSVVPEAPGLYTVTSQTAAEYTVDARERRCTYPDHKHNLPTADGRELRKHRARVAYERQAPGPGVD